MNTRRKLIVALGAGALAVPLASFARQQGKVWRVAFLSPRPRPASLDSDIYGAFQQGMRELGYVEGKNLVIEWRFADNKVERLPGLAAELVQLKVDVILASANQAISAAQKTTTTIPIVMGNSTDPIGSSFVKSLAHPGGNITGLSNLSEDFSPKHLEMLRGMMPRLSRVAVLLNPASPSHSTILKSVQAAAQSAGVTILPLEAQDPQEIESAFIMMIKEKAQAVIVGSNPLFLDQRRRIAELATKNRLPFVSRYREYAEAGCLMSYGPSLTDEYRRAATFVDKILKGARPGDLSVEQPTKFELFINRKTAKTLGLNIPQSLLISADKVIE
jgi:putative ABC transport system substrate-binding protein